MRPTLTSLLITALFAACTPMTPKKVMVFSRGDVEANTQERTLQMPRPGATNHGELAFQFYEESNVELSLNGAAALGLPEKVTIEKDGLNVLNLKPADTLVGHQVQYKTAGTQKTRYAQADMAAAIDSLQQILLLNQQGRFANLFYLKPGQVQHISGSDKAQLIGPFHRLNAMESVDGKMPEVYRFYTLSEVREALANIQKLGSPAKPKP